MLGESLASRLEHIENLELKISKEKDEIFELERTLEEIDEAIKVLGQDAKPYNPVEETK
jgi:predicted RNase H-like nuclease (RuvC/YqgF family)